MKACWILFFAAVGAVCSVAADSVGHGRLQVAANDRYLPYVDGRPFFYLADTAWELFHRLNCEEANRYLEDRARKGFTAIQAVALSEIDGLTVPNAYGDLSLVDKDPSRPNEAYFQRSISRGGAYTARGEPFTLDQSVMKSAYVRQSWFEPRYGVSYEFRLSGRAWDQHTFQTYTPPTSGRGQDWVLFLEAATTPPETRALLPGH